MIEDPNTAADSTDLQTRWALAVGGDGDVRKESLRDLAASYWYCVYAWWRRAGLDPASAATATVASFTRWLGNFPPEASDSGVARMREWLPARLAELAADGVEMEGRGTLEIDAAWAEQRYAGEPAGEPDPIFQRVWALTLLEFTVSTLRGEYAAAGDEALFGELLSFTGFESVTDERYAAAGERVGRSSGAMRKAVFDFRTRQREVLRAIATDTLRDPADTDTELTTLLCAIDAPGIDATPLPSAIGGLRPEEALVRAMQSVRMTGMGRGLWRPPSDSEVARLFPQYEILGLIGRGGMGAVYKARQVDLDRVVAIKLLPLEVSVDRDFAERFRREARAMARLSHPHIITVFDFGTTAEGHLFFVMEFVEGANLHDMIRKVGIEPPQALALAAQVCTALSYSHEKGIIHRDIKPANVMVDLAGQAKVADFGLARLTDIGTGHSGYTVTGAVLGTPDYMAPEQRHGTQVDHRADIYSVGVMLYEMLCRQIPQGAFDPPSKRIGCDVRIDTIVLKAMQQAPDNRYQSTQEMRTAVASALTPGKTAPARRFGPSPPVSTVEPPPRKTSLFPVASVILIAVLGFLVYEKFKPPVERVELAENAESVPPVAPELGKVEDSKPVPSEADASPAPKTEAAPVVVAPAAPPPAPAPPLSETAKWLAAQVPQWQSAYAAEVIGPFEKGVAGLKQQYLAALEKQLTTFAKAGKLDDAVAFRAERDEMASGGEMPAEDEATAPASLKTLRASYRASFIKLDADRFARAKVVHARYDTILGQSQAALTQKQRLDEALEMKAQRDALGTAWLQPPAGAVPKTAAGAAATPPKLDKPSPGIRAPVAGPTIIKDAFTNTLGMRLVPVPGTDVLFCIHETRRKDYAAYAATATGVNGQWKNQEQDGVPAGAQDDHPVVGVNWDDAQAFCEWLSKSEGKTYRLPTDEEWSFAVGIGRLEKFGRAITPEMLHVKVIGEYPWGGTLPPRTKDNAGNFADTAYHEKFPPADWIENYADGYITTAPVMSFKPNKLGIYDLGGNVWEWVQDWYDSEKTQRAVRGASYWDTEDRLLSSHRGHSSAATRQFNHGFRVVVENRILGTVATAPGKPGATPLPVSAASGASVSKPLELPANVAATPKPFVPAYTQPWQAPLRAAGVQSQSFGKLPDGTWVVDLDHSTVRDLKTLSGVPISRLRAGFTDISDLGPLRGMALKELWIFDTKVADLTPLKGMPLQILSLKGTLVADLSALRGMPLTSLKLHDCPDLTDLSPLADNKALTELSLPPKVKDIEFLRAFPKLERISFTVDRQNGERPKQTAAEFWKKYDSEAWVRALRAAGVAENKLQEKEDGTWHVNLEGSTIADLAILRGAPIRVLGLGGLAISDLEPLRGMSLTHLRMFNTGVTDLSPLQGMPLDYLHMSGTQVTDLSPLRGMPLTGIRLHSCKELTDISPLAGCSAFTNVTLPPGAKNIEFLRAMPNLGRLSFTEVSQRDPDKTAAEFWLEYDSQGWLRTLRASGVVKTAKQLPDGTWELDLSDSPFSDLTLLKGAPISRLGLGKTAVTDLSPLRGMALTALNVADTKIAGLSPLAGMALQRLHLGGTAVTDLSPLRGMALVEFEARDTKVADLSPLKGMPITSLNLGGTAIKDLEVLRGMQLTHLWIYSTKFADLSPLEGMPIRYLNMFGSKVTDLSVLRGMPLTLLKLHSSIRELTDVSALAECKELTFVTLPPNAKNIDFLRAFPKLARIDFSETANKPPRPAAEFWHEYDSQSWLRELRNAGFAPRSTRQLPDGTWELDLATSPISDLTVLKGLPISILSLGQTKVTDLAPLRGMSLKELKLFKSPVTDLSPLQGMAIESLNLSGTKVTDLSALRGMPLTLLKLNDCTVLTDLSPLAELKGLTALTLPAAAKDIDFLRTFPKLERIGFKEDAKNGYLPDTTAAEFWKQYDAKKK